MGAVIEKNSIDLDFRNHAYLKMYIEKHKDDTFPLSGVDSEGNHILVSAVKDNVDVATIDDRGWMCHHTYWLDGEVEEWWDH